MKKIKGILFILPALLLASCNFKYTYVIDGYVPETVDDDDDDGDDIDDSGNSGNSGSNASKSSAIDDAGEYDIKIWVDEKIKSLTEAQITSFVGRNPKYKINYDVQSVSEGDATSLMLLDVKNGADLFVFAQDQLARLKVGGALAKITGSYAKKVQEENSPESVAAASLADGSIYAYPMTSDNGYFLMYDSRLLDESDVGNVSTILNKIKGTGKKLYFKGQSDGFYSASYFLAKKKGQPESDPLCNCDWDLDLETGRFTSYHDTFNSANGLTAAKGIKEIADKSLVASDNSASRFNNTAAAIVTGIWDYEVAYNRLAYKDADGKTKSYLKCAEMPCFTVDGQDYHLGSYDGYKLMGLKPQRDSKKASVCRKLAQFLTSEACQTQRFDEVSWGPTNIYSSEEPTVVAHPGLSALKSQHAYATQQGQCPGEWFLSLKTAAGLITTSSTDAQLQSALDTYSASLPGLVSDD